MGERGKYNKIYYTPPPELEEAIGELCKKRGIPVRKFFDGLDISYSLYRSNITGVQPVSIRANKVYEKIMKEYRSL